MKHKILEILQFKKHNCFEMKMNIHECDKRDTQFQIIRKLKATHMLKRENTMQDYK
jgi:hypothetical protein